MGFPTKVFHSMSQELTDSSRGDGPKPVEVVKGNYPAVVGAFNPYVQFTVQCTRVQYIPVGIYIYMIHVIAGVILPLKYYK